MATIINNPTNGESDGGGSMSLIVGVIVLLIVVGLFVVIVLPYIRGIKSNGINVNVKLPTEQTQNPPASTGN